MDVEMNIKALQDVNLLPIRQSGMGGYLHSEILRAAAIYIMAQHDAPETPDQLYGLLANECSMPQLIELNFMDMEELFTEASEMAEGLEI